MGLPGYVMLAMALIITQATYGSMDAVLCPEIKCSPGCVSDVAQMTDLGLCPSCVCPLCWPTCPIGYECQFVICRFGFPCLRQSLCVQKPCMDIICPAGCTKYDSRGCPYCECPPLPTCETTLCTPGYVCEMQLFNPVCVLSVCRGEPHRHVCFPEFPFFINRWTYDPSLGLCQKFRYYFCPGSPNTFRNPQTCELLCENQGGGLPDFSDVFASKLKENECPPPQSCNIVCPSGGLQTDESGCQICECLVE